MRAALLLMLGLPLVAACSTAPAARSPLRERLAGAGSSEIEDALRECLTAAGWKVDPVGSISGGSNVVTASDKNRDQTQVYVHPPDQKPRVTGGPDDPKIWACLSDHLAPGGGAGGEDKAGAGDGGAADKPPQ